MSWSEKTLTNICRIDGVLFIQWSTYQPLEAPAKSSWQRSPLEESAIEIWHSGLLVHLDRERDLLWHFTLSGPTIARDHIPDQAALIAEIAAKHGITNLPDAIYAPPTPATNGVYGTESGLMNTLQGPSTIEASGANHDNYQTYKALQHGLTDTLIYWILQTGQWIRLDANTILLQERAAAQDDLSPPNGASLPAIQVNSLWHPNGLVLVMLHQRSLLRSIVSDPGATEVLLAPLGLEGNPFDPSVDTRIDVDPSSWKHQVSEWLSSRSMNLSRPKAWVGVTLIALDTRRSLLWPAELCFTPGEDRISADLGDGDPLVEAETWLAKVDERVQRLKIQRSEQSQTSQTKKVQSIDDAMMKLLRRGETALSAQAVMGIYPTPPDGPQGSHGAALHDETEASRLGDDGEPMSRMAIEQDMPGIKVSMHGYGDADDDLFEQSGGGMYQDNGITEDDFSFFDEPDQTPQDTFDQVEVPADNFEHAIVPEDGNAEDHAPQMAPNGIKAEEQAESNSSSSVSETPEELPVKIEAMAVDPDPEPISPVVSSNKYGALGKFASQISVLPTTIRPSRSPERGQLIPRLTHDDLDDVEMNSSPSTPSDSAEVTPYVGPVDHASMGQSREETPSQKRMGREPPETVFNALLRAAQESSTPNVATESSRQLPEKADATIQLAQVLADQGVRYYHGFGTQSQKSPDTRVLDYALEVVRSVLPVSVQCSSEQCGKLTAPLKVSPQVRPIRPTHRKPEQQRNGAHANSDHFKLDTPQFRTKRGARSLDLSLYALRFWEELGLSPYWGSKNVTAFFLHPDLDLLRRGAASFLDAVGSTYMSLRLGLHASGSPLIKGLDDGLLAVPSSKDADGEIYDRFGRSLSPLASEKSTIVLYMVNQSDTFVELKHLCSLFIRIFDAYAGSLRSSTNPSDLVLKVIPGSAIASHKKLAIPTVTELIRVAKELYESCPTGVAASSPYASLSLVELTPVLPHGVDFKLSLENPATLLQQESVAHVAYRWEKESPWLTVAITDTLGCHNWTGAYFVGSMSESATTFRAIAREILEISCEAFSASHGRPRILITHDQHLPAAELDVWIAVARSKDLALAVVCLDTEPPLQILQQDGLAADAMPPPSLAGATDLLSPELTASRTAEEADSRARLVDPTEEVSAAITSCSIGVASNRLVLTASLGSGYLYRSSGTFLGVSIVHAEHYDLDIHELLKMTYDLTCLARARGSVFEMPWHVAVAREAHITLRSSGL